MKERVYINIAQIVTVKPGNFGQMLVNFDTLVGFSNLSACDHFTTLLVFVFLIKDITSSLFKKIFAIKTVENFMSKVTCFYGIS